MTSYTWKGVSSDWNLASNWTPAGGPPTAFDTATINGSATDTVTVDTPDGAYSLTLSDANATLNDDGASASLTISGTLTMTDGALNISPDADGGVLAVGALTLSGGALTINTGGLLTLSGTLSQTGGTLTLNDGGAISGGTIDSTAGTLAFEGGTLSGVTFDGPLNLTAPLASVQLANGTIVVGSSGSGPGTINDNGAGDTLGFDNTQTVSSETINLGSTAFDYLSENDTGAVGNQVLTLASSVTVDVQGSAIIYDSAYSGDGIVNEGVIDQTSAGQLDIEPTTFTNSGTIDAKTTNGQLIIDPATFTNSGTIDVANGEIVTIEPTTFTTTASSVIAIGANSSVTIEPTNSWTNLGSITLASGGSLYLYGPMSAAGLGSVKNSGGTVYIAGTWNNAGQTLNGSASFGALALYGGMISGGTVTSAGASFTNLGGTLSGVTFEGPLDLTASGASVGLASGTTVVGSSGSGPGTINDTGEVAQLHFDDTQTFNNATINLGNATGSCYLEENDSTGSGTVLTLGSNVTIDESRFAQINTGGEAGDGIVNKGAIKQSGTSGSLYFGGNSLTNSGMITGASSDGALTIDTTAFTNSGAIDIANGETVTIEPTTFTTTASSVIDIGANSSLAIEPTNSWTNLGSIMLAGDASLTSSSVTNRGLLEGTGGTGTGVVTSKVINTGTIEASSGTLEVKGAVTGKGMDTIAGGATLEFGAGVSSAKTLGDQDINFTGGGTLDLLKPTSFYGEVSDFGAGDTVELLGSRAFSRISHAADVTTLTLANSSTTHAFEFVGDYSRSDFSIASGTTTKIGFA